MIIKPENLYLDLMKKTLSFTLWPEPPIPLLDEWNYLNRPIKKIIITVISKIFAMKQIYLMKERNFTEQQRIDGEIWPRYAYTMIGMKRLNNLQTSIETVIKENIDGDLIETGVWRGGSCIFMRAVLAAYGIQNRKVILADSFIGLPNPNSTEYIQDKNDIHFIYKYLSVSKTDVQANFQKFGLLDQNVIFLEGWFKDTLPNAPIEKLSILRLDGDMYSSTMEALVNLYPKLSIGGFCIVDDYVLPGCKSAVNDFLKTNKIDADLKIIDNSSIYWRKR